MRRVLPIGIRLADVAEFYRRRRIARVDRDVSVDAYATWPLADPEEK